MQAMSPTFVSLIRLNFIVPIFYFVRYSVVLIIMITLMISTKQYVGDPIACMPPPHFTESMVEYTNHLCWVGKTDIMLFV